MSPRLFWSLLLGVLVLFGVPLTILYLRTHERVTETVQLPPQGEAGYNPLYVLGQALRADGIEVHSRPRLDLQQMALGPHDTVVLLQDSSELPAPAARPCWPGLVVAICWCVRRRRPRTTPAARRAPAGPAGRGQPVSAERLPAIPRHR
jgi:hypothetical protein